jgi:coproporphyrinogen III oxidase-like Fe-S oxidoreductase
LNRKQNIHELLSSTEIKLYLHMKWCATCCLYMINNLISLGHVQYKKCL